MDWGKEPRSTMSGSKQVFQKSELLRAGVLVVFMSAFILPESSSPASTAALERQAIPTRKSALAEAAKQMVPGKWLHFTAAENASWNHGAVLQLPMASTDNATTWSTKGLWNPLTREFYFIGGAHCGGGHCPGSTEVLRYADVDNTWSVNANNDMGHSYEGPSLSTSAAHNNIYFRPYSSNTVQVYSLASHSWTETLNPIPSSGPDCCLALEYFPDRDSLITIDNDWGIFEFSFSSGKWSGCLIGTVHWGCGTTHSMCETGSTSAPWARYDLAHHRLLFGGCTNVYSLSSDMQATQLPSAPFTISAAPSGSPITIDPQTGQLVSWDPTGNTFTLEGSNWKNLGTSPFSDPVHNGLVCAPVSTYGVTLCLYAGKNSSPVTNGTVWLYKLGPALPEIRATATPVPVPVLIPTPVSSKAAPAGTKPAGNSGGNAWTSRIAGVNVPGGAASVIGFQSFDTFPATNRQQYFKLYDPASISTDCGIAADGCSLKFSILKGYQQGEPGWFDWNFSPDLSKTFGEGQEFYIQYRERLDPGMLNMANFPNSGGFKHDIITEGDTLSRAARDCSNSPGEVVTTEGIAGIPTVYHNCGYGDGSFAFMKTGYQGIQLAGIVNTNFLDQNAAGCPHYSGRGIPNSDPTCWRYVGGEWFTVQMHIKVGTFGHPDSVVEMWLAHEGQPAQLVVNAADAALVNDGSGGASRKYGKIQLSAYSTGMSGSLVNTAVWFDDLMVAARRIPDPNVATPNAPDSLHLSDVTSHRVTVNWRVNSQNGTTQDDTGFLVERCRGDGAACFPNPQTGFVQIGVTAPGAGSFVDKTVAQHATYTYRVRARNRAGNSSYSAAQCFNAGSTCGGTVVVP